MQYIDLISNENVNIQIFSKNREKLFIGVLANKETYKQTNKKADKQIDRRADSCKCKRQVKTKSNIF